jgi:hypothetical protein
MKTKFKFYLAFLLLISIGIGGDLSFAQSTDSNLVYLPIVYQPPVVRLDDPQLFVGKYCEGSVVGKVTNLSNQTVYDVNLTASLFLDSELVEVITGTTGLPATFSYDFNLFMLYPENFDYFCGDGFSVEVTVDSWSFEHDPEYLPLTVLSKIRTGGHEIGELSGEIRNDNPVPVTSIEMMVYPDTYFLTFATPDKTSLAPGEITTYTAGLYYPGFSSGEDYTVWAQGAVDQ